MGNEVSVEDLTPELILQIAENLSYRDLRNLPLTNPQYAAIARLPTYQALLTKKYNEIPELVERYMTDLIYKALGQGMRGIMGQGWIRMQHPRSTTLLKRIDSTTIKVHGTYDTMTNEEAYTEIRQHVKDKSYIFFDAFIIDSELMTIVKKIPHFKIDEYDEVKLPLVVTIPAMIEREINN